MKVLITKTCSADGKHLENGQTYDLSDVAAKELIKLGRAKEAIEVPAPAPKPKPKKKVETADVLK
tara:strand:- start:1099 stop:1293 length:195 start_codon:yes stop_codon:yes gene_type:complete